MPNTTFFETMKKYSLVAHVLLVLCVDAAFAQFIGPQTQPFDLTRQRTLSPQQQGHILSDIQQHQHRFAPPQSAQFGVFDPSLQQSQLFGVDPTVQTQQHHTQTIFQPHLNQKIGSISDAVLAAGQNPQLGQLTPEEQAERLKELREKQAIIEKHNQFVEKQYEKALKKAQSEHVEFLQNQRELKKKLYQSLYQNKDTNYDTIRYTQSNARYIYPEETELFKLAVKKYYEEHPTTTTTTTTTPKPTTTTQKTRPTTKRVDPELFLTTAHSKLYSQIKTATEGKSLGVEQFLPTAIPTKKSIQTLEDLDFLQKQYKTQQIKKDDLLAQLRLAIGENVGEEIGKNLTSREISLPNGQTVQIIRTTDPKLIPGGKALDLSSPDLQKLLSTTTPRPPKAILEELTKGVLPPGANFELLKQGTSGLEEVGGLPQNLPNQKKVTFVLLEEQNDGSFKVQGVKGNGEKEKSEVDVDSILQKIKEGEIKLPPNTKLRNATTLRPTTSGVSILPNSLPPADEEDISATPILKTNIGTHFIASSTTTPRTSPIYSSTTAHSTTSRSISSPSPKSINLHSSASSDLIRQASTSSPINQNSIYPSLQTILPPKPTNPTYPTTLSNSVTIFQSHSTAAPTVQTYLEESGRQIELPDVLKKEGLFAMSRFLRQSGLDTILNETGPYTIFVPSDKAFRTLMVQLGGPEKAEEKFKENPRLLSGLLLHHVIPGAFKIGSLQDEMTGVSLAGTQLRVNQYNMHDLEWNDIKITTINGAKILDERKDIEIPQGIAHSIDRVMFPLPVGDIVQTLQSDRERRFTNFLRALFASGLAESLQDEPGMLEPIFAKINQCMKDGGTFTIETLPIDTSIFGDYFRGSLTLKRIRVTELHDVNEAAKSRGLVQKSFDITIPVKIETDYELNGVIFGFVDIFGSGVSKDSLNINLKGDVAYEEPSPDPGKQLKITVLNFESPKLDPKFSFTGLQGDERISKLISNQLTQILSQISEEMLKEEIEKLLPKIKDVLNDFFAFADLKLILNALNFLCYFE